MAMTESATHPGGRPSRNEAARRRRHALDVAHRLFLERGYSATSLEAIARESGTAKKTLYRHFGDKGGLFGAVIRQRTNDWLESLSDLLAHDCPPEQALRAVARQVVEASTRPQAVAVQRLVFTEAPRFPELAHFYHENGVARGLQPLVDYLAAQTALGTLDIADPQLAAEQFVFLVSGALRRRALLGIADALDENRRAAMVEEGVELFLHGCAARRGRHA